MVDYTKRNVVNGKLISSGKKKRSRSAKKMTPAVRYLRYNLTNGNAGVETSHYIDLARDLSAINRRLMRSGRVYHIKRVSIVSSNTGQSQGPSPGGSAFDLKAGKISFSTIPDSWTARGAWNRGFKAWQKMQSKALEATGLNIAPTWNDFKAYLSYDMVSGTKPVPRDNGGNALSLGEWTYSTYQSPDGTTSNDSMVCHMLGGHNGTPGSGSMGSVGLIQSFGDSRATVNNDSPTVQSAALDDPIANLFDDGTVHDEIIGDMRTKNEDAPYDLLTYAGEGGNHPKPLVVQETTLGTDGKAVLGGFAAMLGQIEVEISSPFAAVIYGVVEEQGLGNNRGIKADVIW